MRGSGSPGHAVGPDSPRLSQQRWTAVCAAKDANVSRFVFEPFRRMPEVFPPD
jgi:hypothetical protein